MNEEFAQGCRRESVPQYQVDRAWYRVPIEGPCDFTVKVVANALEFKRLPSECGAPTGATVGRALSVDDDMNPFTGDLERGWALWVRSYSKESLAEFTLTTKPREEKPHPAKGYTTVAEDAQRLMDRANGKPQTWCGCGWHSFHADADPYAEHRDWMRVRCKMERNPGGTSWSALDKVVGIGISSPPRHAEVWVQTQHWDSEGT